MWASIRSVGQWTKVDGNLGALPHIDECPWEFDVECDDPSVFGTGLCPEGFDIEACEIFLP